MIRSSDLIPWLKSISGSLSFHGVAKARLSQKAIDKFLSLVKDGMFPELLLIRQYRSGLLHIMRTR